MAILKDKLKSQIQSQFPEHIQARHPQLVEFTKEYYQFMESAQITLTSITDQDQILLETTSEGFLLFNQTDKNGRDEGDRIVDEESAGGEFQKGEIITGSTSGQTATILAEDSDALKLYITSNSKFVTGETITGGTSGATGVIGKYRANPVENINQLLDYTDVSDTLDDFFENFRNTFLNTIPTNLTTGLNKRNFVKNVLQLYQRKGNKKGHEIFFRALLNETPSITYPRDQLLKISAGIFNTDTTLKATLISPSTSTLINLVGQTITQTAVVGNDKVNTATAVVDAVTTEIIDSQTVGTLALLEDSITGTFVSDTGEVILMEDGDNIVLEEDGSSKILEESIVEFTATDNTDSDVIITGRVHRIIASVNVDSGGSYYTEAQQIPISNQNGGAGANVQISKVGQGTVTKVVVENGGSGYTVGDNLTVTNDNTDGTGFSGKVSIINGGFSLEQDRQEDGRIINTDINSITPIPKEDEDEEDNEYPRKAKKKSSSTSSFRYAQAGDFTLSSRKHINIGVGENFILNTKGYSVIQTKNIYIGKEAKKREQPMVLGEELRKMLEDIVNILSNAHALVQGVPVPLVDNVGAPLSANKIISGTTRSLEDILKDLQQEEFNPQINEENKPVGDRTTGGTPILSNHHFIDPNRS